MKNKELRSKAVQELIKTEESYLRQLETLQKYFITPCLEQGLLSPALHAKVFGELPALHALNSELLERLTAPLAESIAEASEQNASHSLHAKESTLDPSVYLKINVGEAFLKIAPFLKVYASYASNYQQSLSIIQEQEQLSPKLHSFLRTTEFRPEVQCKLVSLLIVPVQRIPRYTLLLTEILRHLPPGHPHKQDLERSVSMVAGAAQRVDECVGEGEEMQRLLVLQKALHNEKPNIIAPGRKLLKTGLLHKANRSDNKSVPRLFFLFTDVLMYTKPPSKPRLPAGANPDHFVFDIGSVAQYRPGSLTCCCVMPLRHCSVMPLFTHGRNTAVFRIICRSEDLTVFSKESKSEGQAWIDSIGAAISAAVANRKTLKKDSSAKRPLRRPAIKKGIGLQEEGLPQLEVTSPRRCLSPIVGSPSSVASSPSSSRSSPFFKYLRAPHLWRGRSNAASPEEDEGVRKRCGSESTPPSGNAKQRRCRTMSIQTEKVLEGSSQMSYKPTLRQGFISKSANKRPHSIENDVVKVCENMDQHKENLDFASPVKIRILDASPCKPGNVTFRHKINPYRSKWESGEINVPPETSGSSSSLFESVKPKVINNPNNILQSSPVRYFPGKDIRTINGFCPLRPAYNSDKLVPQNSSEDAVGPSVTRARHLRRRSRSLTAVSSPLAAVSSKTLSPSVNSSCSVKSYSPTSHKYNTRNSPSESSFRAKLPTRINKKMSASAENLDSDRDMWKREKFWGAKVPPFLVPSKIFSSFPKKKT